MAQGKPLDLSEARQTGMVAFFQKLPKPAAGLSPAAAAAAAAAAPRLAQLRLRLEQGLDSTRLEWIAGTAGKAGAAGADADAEAYAARLLNECHSLPLTVAFVVQRALP